LVCVRARDPMGNQPSAEDAVVATDECVPVVSTAAAEDTVVATDECVPVVGTAACAPPSSKKRQLVDAEEHNTSRQRTDRLPAPAETTDAWSGQTGFGELPAAEKAFVWSDLAPAPQAGYAQERRVWLPEEDHLIATSVEEIGCRWRTIAARMPGRTDDAVRNRWNRLQEMLHNRVAHTMGNDDGRRVYKCSKCGQQKRDHVCPYATAFFFGEHHSEKDAGKPMRLTWTPHEDHLIRNNVAHVGHKWGYISSLLVGRTEHAVRNRWHRLQSHDEEALACGRPNPHSLPGGEYALGDEGLVPSDYRRCPVADGNRRPIADCWEPVGLLAPSNR